MYLRVDFTCEGVPFAFSSSTTRSLADKALAHFGHSGLSTLVADLPLGKELSSSFSPFHIQILNSQGQGTAYVL